MDQNIHYPGIDIKKKNVDTAPNTYPISNNKFNPFVLSDLDYTNLDLSKKKKINSFNPNNKKRISKKNKLSKIEEVNNQEQNIFNKPIINQSTNSKKSQDLKYWEYGASGLKIKNFTNVMSKNLAVLYYLDKSFETLQKQHQFSISKLFDKKHPDEYIDIVETDGISSKLESLDGKVTLSISSNKISGKYRIVGASQTIIELNDKTKFLPEELVKKKIPELDTVLNNLDNIKMVLKLTNVLKLFEGSSGLENLDFEITSDYSDLSMDFDNIISNVSKKILEYKKEDKEKNLLKPNSNFAFYIKMYEINGKAFVIDGPSNLIYYVKEKEDLKSKKIYINFYVFEIDDNWKIKNNL